MQHQSLSTSANVNSPQIVGVPAIMHAMHKAAIAIWGNLDGYVEKMSSNFSPLDSLFADILNEYKEEMYPLLADGDNFSISQDRLFSMMQQLVAENADKKDGRTSLLLKLLDKWYDYAQETQQPFAFDRAAAEQFRTLLLQQLYEVVDGDGKSNDGDYRYLDDCTIFDNRSIKHLSPIYTKLGLGESLEGDVVATIAQHKSFVRTHPWVLGSITDAPKERNENGEEIPFEDIPNEVRPQKQSVTRAYVATTGANPNKIRDQFGLDRDPEHDEIAR